MLRLLIICMPLLLLPRTTASDTRSSPDPSELQRNRAVERIGTLVRTRFALAASAVGCRYAENLYGYHLLLAKLSGAQRNLVRSAEGQGRDQGAARQVDGSPSACTAALAALRKVDDALLVMAERVGVPEATDR